MELIQSYFPDLSDKQISQFKALGPLYREWNEKINVVSRKDIDHLYEHHILHSLALARYNQKVRIVPIDHDYIQSESGPTRLLSPH